MERAGTALLLAATFCSCLTAEQPIRQPNSYGNSFNGPALALECVARLKADPARFFQTVRSESPEARRTCVNQLLQSLTPEPEFTAEDFQNALTRDPHGNLSPESPQLARKMMDRLGVNLNVAKAVAELAAGRLIDDPGAIRPLIRCLNHPLLPVSQSCEDALVSLTRHSYGWKFYYDQPPPPTEEGRQRLVADWTKWEEQMKEGHPIFDEWLASRCLAAGHELGERLAGVLKDTVASGYLDHLKNKRLDDLGGPSAEKIFQFGVGVGNAANWPRGTKLDGVGIGIFRPGIAHPLSKSPEDHAVPVQALFGKSVAPETIYRENFPALDLEFRVEIDTSDDRVRDACFLAVKEALNGLRSANEMVASRR